MSTSQDKIPFDAKLKYAGEYQLDQILGALRQRGINLPQEEIRDRLILALHSRSFTEKVVKQIEAFPKRTADMSLKEKYAAAGWPEHQPGQKMGTREQSRAVIESLINGTYKQERAPEKPQSIKDKIGAAQNETKMQTNKPPAACKERDELT